MGLTQKGVPMSQDWTRLFFVLSLVGLASNAYSEVPPENGEGAPKNVLSKFKLFGYFNLAYGETDGRQYRGATEDGSFEFRTAALQARFAATPNAEFVVQLASEHVGESPTNSLRDDLDLDWLFFKYRFKNGTQVRLGRVPLPIGIYNEIKEVGTALPFYRPSDNFYGEGTWTSDSVDGAVLSHDFSTESGWSFNFDLYAGSWDRIETDGGTLRFAEAEIDDAVGVFTWVTTPWDGLRVGLGYNRFTTRGGVFLPPGATDDEKTRYLSIDASFEPVTFRFEASRRNFTGGYWQPYYAELSVRFASRWQASVLYDVGELYYEIPFFATFDDKVEELWGLGLKYEIRPGWVAKVEHRWSQTYGQIEDVQLSLFFDEPVDVKLLIASLAVSF